MPATLSERYVGHLYGNTKNWGGEKPPVSWWFFIGPGLLLAGTIFFAFMDAPESAWFTGMSLLVITWFGFHMWLCHGIVRLIEAKDAEIEQLKKISQRTPGNAGAT